MQAELFNTAPGKKETEIEDININTFMLYFNDEEKKDVVKITKKICKLHDVDNVSDLFLVWLRKENEKLNPKSEKNEVA